MYYKMNTADEILKKYEDENEYHFHQVDREWLIKAMDEYLEQGCEHIQKIYNRPRKELKPLEGLYRKENPKFNGKFYLPDTTKFYKWIRIKILGYREKLIIALEKVTEKYEGGEIFLGYCKNNDYSLISKKPSELIDEILDNI